MIKNNDCFNTPKSFFNQLNNVFNFTLDAACDSTNILCDKGFEYDKGRNGLIEQWGNERVFCNPPFSTKSKWIEKAVNEVENNECPLVVMVLPLNCMSAKSFHEKVIGGGYFYEILSGRIQFIDNQTKKIMNGNNTGTVVVYFKKRLSIAKEAS